MLQKCFWQPSHSTTMSFSSVKYLRLTEHVQQSSVLLSRNDVHRKFAAAAVLGSGLPSRDCTLDTESLFSRGRNGFVLACLFLCDASLGGLPRFFFISRFPCFVSIVYFFNQLFGIGFARACFGGRYLVPLARSQRCSQWLLGNASVYKQFRPRGESCYLQASDSPRILLISPFRWYQRDPRPLNLQFDKTWDTLAGFFLFFCSYLREGFSRPVATLPVTWPSTVQIPTNFGLDWNWSSIQFLISNLEQIELFMYINGIL